MERFHWKWCQERKQYRHSACNCPFPWLPVLSRDQGDPCLGKAWRAEGQSSSVWGLWSGERMRSSRELLLCLVRTSAQEPSVAIRTTSPPPASQTRATRSGWCSALFTDTGRQAEEQPVNTFCVLLLLEMPIRGMVGSFSPPKLAWESTRASGQCPLPGSLWSGEKYGAFSHFFALLPDQARNGAYWHSFLQAKFSHKRDLPGWDLEKSSSGRGMSIATPYPPQEKLSEGFYTYHFYKENHW